SPAASALSVLGHTILGGNLAVTGSTFKLDGFTSCSGLSNGGKLTTDADGAVTCSADVSGGAASPAGNDTDVQFNDGGTTAGFSTLAFTKSTSLLTTGDLSLVGSDLNFGNGASGAATSTISGQYGKLGFATTAPYAQVAIEYDQNIVGSSTPVFVVSDSGSSSPAFEISYGGTSTFGGDAVFRGVITTDAKSTGQGLTFRASGSGTGATSTGSIYFQDSGGTTRGRFQAEVKDNGDGADGAVTNLSQTSATYECDKDDIPDTGAVSTATGASCASVDLGFSTAAGPGDEYPTMATSGSNYIQVATTATAWLVPGDEIMIIQMESAATSTGGTGLLPNASSTPSGAIGYYEFKIVDEITNTGRIAVTSNLEHTYYDDDLRNQAQVIRVPNWSSLTIEEGETLTVRRYATTTYTSAGTPDGTSGNTGVGGILVFRVSGELTITAKKGIDVSGKGHIGGIFSTTTAIGGIVLTGNAGNDGNIGGAGYGGFGPGGGGPGFGGGGGGGGTGDATHAGGGGGGGGSGGYGAGGSYAIPTMDGVNGAGGGAGGVGALLGGASGGGASGGGGGSAATSTPYLPR
ncbi:MAG: filamentous hemagglutinin family domain-containing protein, partial [Halothiobacillaceae bacterium]